MGGRCCLLITWPEVTCDKHPSPLPFFTTVCLKCDLQERLLSPSLLPGTADGSVRMDDPKGDFSTLYQMASQPSACRYKLRVIKYGPRELTGPCKCWLLLSPWLENVETECWAGRNQVQSSTCRCEHEGARSGCWTCGNERAEDGDVPQ